MAVFQKHSDSAEPS